MIRLATVEDAHLVHKIMLSAFEEYRHLDIPSSALSETVSGIEEALKKGAQKALLCFSDNLPLGSVRFKTDKDSLYFFRLSVCPEARGRGIAGEMLSWLENYAREQGLAGIWCMVRASITQNVRFYEAAGYVVDKEELIKNPDGYFVKTVIMKKDF